MPTRTLGALISRALAKGLDPLTPALAVTRATRPDQHVIEAAVGELPERIAEAELPGPILVILGRVCSRSATSRVHRLARTVEHR